MQGTPKTLIASINNGANEYMVESLRSDVTNTESEYVKKHVKDFLAQKFNAAMLEHPELEGELMKLYMEIVR